MSDLFDIVNKLRTILTRREKLWLVFLAIFSVIISVIETTALYVILPFISITTDFSNIYNNEYIYYLYSMLGFDTPVKFIIFFAICISVFYIFRAILGILYQYSLARFSYGRYLTISYKLLQNYLNMPYKEFINRNPSVLTKSIITEAYYLVNLISHFLFMLSEVFVIAFIYIFLLSINWKITLFISFIVATNVFIMKFIVSKEIKKQGIKRDFFQEKLYRLLSSTFGNFKLIKLRAINEEITKEFKISSKGFSEANIVYNTLAHIPRFYLETLGFVSLIFIISYWIWKYNSDISRALPILSAFMVGLYRFLPSANRIFTNYNSIIFFLKSLYNLYPDLNTKSEPLGSEDISFKERIKLENVSFAYSSDRYILKDINLEILKGDKVGIVGESGSGKSTLIDLIMGLYKPTHGKIFVDNVELSDENLISWRKKIGYIPQTIYLFDGTVAENVAMSKDFDENKVKQALEKAKLLDFLEENHEGIYTQVGENGIKLSGGQKQRVAIARALYHDPEVLILDEATSALDKETEKQIMEELYKIAEDKTMIIVAHRTSTLNNCNRIFTVMNGMVLELSNKASLASITSE